MCTSEIFFQSFVITTSPDRKTQTHFLFENSSSYLTLPIPIPDERKKLT